MANPTPYDPDYSYTAFQQGQGDNDFPGTEIDNDLADIARSIDETQAALADVRRSDGKLVNGIVDRDALSPSIITTDMQEIPFADAATARAGVRDDIPMSPQSTALAIRDRVLSVFDEGFIPYGLQDAIRAGAHTDDVAPYIKLAYDAAAARKCALLVPGGHYYLKSQIDITSAVRVYGDGWSESPVPANGTWFIHAASGVIPFRLSGVAARGTSFNDIAFFQQHATPSGGWSPTAYDWLFDCQSMLGGLDLNNVFLCAIRKAIRSRLSGRLFLNRVKGQVFECLADIDQALDVPNFHDIHMWPFWISSTQIKTWQIANCDYYRLARVDTPIFSGKQFYFNGRSAVRCLDLGNGPPTRLEFGSLRAESCKYGLWSDSTANGTTGYIGHLDHFGEDISPNTAIVGSNSIMIEGTGCHWQLASMRAEIVGQSYVREMQNSNTVEIGLFRGANHNLDADGSAAFHMANAVSGTVNRVLFAAPPFIEAGSYTLVNAGTNGVLNRPAMSTQGLDGLDYVYDIAANHIVLTASGPASVIGVTHQTKGVGSDFQRLINGTLREFLHDDANANTQIEWKLGLNFIQLLAVGAATNADIFLTAKGVGNVNVGSAWNGPHFVMGAFHMWVDGSGRLRIKTGAPASDTDGTVIGTQS